MICNLLPLIRAGFERRCALALFAALLWSAVSVGMANESSAAKPTTSTCDSCGIRPQDQVFLLSTRHLGCDALDSAKPNFDLSRYEDRLWKSAPGYDFCHNDRGIRTIIYVHGNRVDASFATQGGLTVYRQLVACANEEPIRFIIWSWCSDRIRGPRRDARAKADAADEEAVLFGRFISQLPADQEVGLIGFSFGARIVSGGLHMVGGGSWLGYRLPACAPSRFHAVLWAGALNNDWLLPGRSHDHAIKACQHWLIMINQCDESLKFFPLLDRRCGGAEALGYTGVAGKSQLGELANSIRECTVQHLIGKSHMTLSYPQSAEIMHETRQVVLGIE